MGSQANIQRSHRGLAFAYPLRMTNRWAALTILAVLVPSMAACTVVQPWQRGKLSTRVMQPDPDPDEQKLDGHVHEYREGSIGGSGVRGGGCGCN
jgi:hypothetical protein